MKLSAPQVQRFWREWAKSCQVMNWTRAAGMSAAEIDAKRKEFLAGCGFDSLTMVDRTAGFTRVLNELIVLQGVSLKAAHETIDPSLNEARILRNQIAADLVPCLEVYIEHSFGYITAILKNRFRGLALEELNAAQLKAFRDTLNARIHALRKKAGHMIHAMKLLASVPCDCAECARPKLTLPPLPASESNLKPEHEEEPF